MNQQKLRQLTRNSAFLWKSSGVLAALLIVVGAGLSFLNAGRMDTYERVLSTPRQIDEFHDQLEGVRNVGVAPEALALALRESLESAAAFHEKLLDVSYLLYYFAPEKPLDLPRVEGLSTNQWAIAKALVAACAEPDDEAAPRPLENLAAGDAAPIDANFALALAWENRDDDPASITALNREIDLHDSRHARQRLVDAYLDLKKYAALEALAADPDYEEFITPYVLRDIALDRMDWPMLLKTHFPAMYEGTDPAMVLLAALSGLVWAVVLIRFNGSARGVGWFVVPALALGALSAHATLLVVFWLEHQVGFGFGENLVQQLIYCLGIGLREEGLKLLFFVPLIPLLARRADLEILTVAGLVGLGFALEENINYFEASAGLSAVARFATANFLHVALTAMCGLTLTRAFVHRGEDVQHAAVTFTLAVAVHGLYDAFLMVWVLADYSWLTYTVFVLMGYQYFGWLRHLREEWKDPFSVTAVFTYGVILVTGFSFALHAWNAGPFIAFQAVVGEVIGVAIILILFYREIPETLD